ncbi:DUF4393 domain-containing protein [Acetobacterium tundrae]|uniref:DUF4393 domain-containing protein n=1 Tax=Acetobacterium tundrae TaxID=132932 RepID=A0ABR6WPN9_9FIRM|nr:DUF4393 domain-containing protein [Acetobacterium tundrae]MBC3798467.1 DUF4393 domain-containing protein [Acetobacterium tundrae]
MEGKKNLTEQVTNAVSDITKPIYDDLAHPAAEESGKFLGRIPRLLNALCINFDIWATRKEHNLKMVERELDYLLHEAPVEKIVGPDPYIAVPVLQALSYSYDDNELRSMYSHLLSKAMHADYKFDVHPSFVEIIKQLSPVDCLVFKEIMSIHENPIIHAILYNSDNYEDGTDCEIIHTNINALSSCEYDQSKISIDNLIRLNLINVPSDYSYTEKEIYLSVTNSAFCKELESKYGRRLTYSYRCVIKTNFSELFYRICVMGI